MVVESLTKKEITHIQNALLDAGLEEVVKTGPSFEGRFLVLKRKSELVLTSRKIKGEEEGMSA